MLAAIAEAVGLVETDRLLGHLARSWNEITRAECVILSVQCGRPGCYRTALVDAAGCLTHADDRLSEKTDLIPGLMEQVLPRARGSAETHSSERSSGEIIGKTLVNRADGRLIGGIVLVGAAPLPDPLDDQFRGAAAALLNRAVANERLLRDAKLESLAEFAAGAGHEINNPLAAISGRAQILLQDETDPQRRRHLTTIGAQALRIRDMIGDTMLFARPPQPEPQQLNLVDLLDRVLEKFAAECESRKFALKKKWDPKTELPIWADETQLSVVISELVRNAMEASTEGGTIQIIAGCETVSGSAWALLTVRDEGAGLSAEAAEHLFDPFYSGRQAGRGLGFGLSKCWRIVTNHGGQIDVEDELEQGFGMFIRWPASERPRPSST